MQRECFSSSSPEGNKQIIDDEKMYLMYGVRIYDETD